MEYLIAVILCVLVFQIYIYFYSKGKKKSPIKEITVIEKYKIKSRGQLFNLINSPNIPEEDRLALEDYYQKGL